MAAPPPSDQIYRITQYGDFEQPQVLSLKHGVVTILPPNAVPKDDQRWRLVHGFNPVLRAFQNPADFNVPSRSLSYEGDAEERKRIILGPLKKDPTREWHIEPGPPVEGPFQAYFIRTNDKKALGIDIANISDIYPPQLELVDGPGILWVFEHLKDH